jgi:hypothetical protein
MPAEERRAMAREVDTSQLQDELVKVLKEGNEGRARKLVLLLGEKPRQIRAVLEAMLDHADALVRQAAAFGLGELGGAASARRLEQQLAVEEARRDYDGESVVEELTRALGRIEEDSARASLVRRLERLTAGKSDPSGINELALALWRRRHPELIPALRRSLERLPVPEQRPLGGLLVLMEESPDALRTWALTPSIPVEQKTDVLVLLEEDLPDALLPTLPAFISLAPQLFEKPVGRKSGAAYYCEHLFSLLLAHRERTLVALPEEARSTLRTVARDLVVATSPVPSLWAAVLLKAVGRPEDAEVLEAHCPADPTFAKVFKDAAHTLRSLRKN